MPKKKYFIHKTSLMDRDVSIGQGTKIWHFSHIMSGTTIGANCILGQNVFIGEKVKIGNGVKIQNNVSIFQGVKINDFVFCGPSVTFTNVKKARSQFPVNKNYDETIVGKGVTLGANSTIVCPVKIGDYAFIGAGAVVTKDIKNYVLAYGNPAKNHGYVCKCGATLNFKTKNRSHCLKCSRRYEKKGEKVALIS